ncbi:MAG: tyrosinase family protein [Prosthecobacter sp.]|nr:tyrosinase family protein [Prosthecobacter sp.]
MALGDGIRRNIASVDPSERALLRDAMTQLNNSPFIFPGSRTDTPIAGGVTWWFKQDEIHQSTHVHGGPEFIPWHREIVNRLEAMLRQVNPQLSLHYWDWTQDPRAIPDANLGSGNTGTLNLFTADFMGYGGSSSSEIGAPWLGAGYYNPATSQDRDSTGNPADPPRFVRRSINGSPASAAGDVSIVNAVDYTAMRGLLESVHNAMHGFVNMGSQHTAFRDPFVFLLHSNVDRLYARWQTDPAHQERLNPTTVYGAESTDPELNGPIPPWSGTPPTVRPFAPPENQQSAKTYKDPLIVNPPYYDTNQTPGPAPSGIPFKLLVHLQDIGDVVVNNDEFGGTRGESRRLEGFQINILPAVPGLSCSYMAHLQDIGDVPAVNEGQFIGTRGESRRLEGFAITLTGPAAASYNVSYMAHLQDIGDTAFYSNGQFCGTRGESRRVEGMLVRIQPN